MTTEEQQVRQYSGLIRQEGERNQVPPSVVAAIMLIESGGNPQATSPMNYDWHGNEIGQAKGLMQIMPWHFDPDHDPHDPATNIAVGARILRDNYRRWGTWEQAAAAYFGAIDAHGNITGATDATGTSGNRYVVLAMAARQRFLDLDESQAKAIILGALDTLWGIANSLEATGEAEQAGRIRDYVVVIKQAAGFD